MSHLRTLLRRSPLVTLALATGVMACSQTEDTRTASQDAGADRSAGGTPGAGGTGQAGSTGSGGKGGISGTGGSVRDASTEASAGGSRDAGLDGSSTIKVTVGPTVQVVAGDLAPDLLRVAVDRKRDRVYLSWNTYPPLSIDAAARGEIEIYSYLAVSKDGGETFGPAKQLGGLDGTGDQGPVVQVSDDGTLFVAWTHFGTTLLDPLNPYSQPSWQLVARSTDGGDTLSTPVVVPSTATNAVEVFMTLLASPDGKTVTVSWFDYTIAPPGRDATVLFAATSHNGGLTFDPPVEASPAVCVCCQPTGVFLNGHPGLAMRGWVSGGDDGDLRDPILYLSSDQGTHWNAGVNFHHDGFRIDGCPHIGPGAAVGPDGTLHTSWWTGADGRAGYWYATSKDGVTFSEPQRLDPLDSVPHSQNMTLGVDDRGVAWVPTMIPGPLPDGAWQPTRGTIKLWAVPPGGTARPIDTATVSGIVPVAAALTSGAVMAWVDGNRILSQRVER